MEIVFVALLLAGGLWLYRWRARSRGEALRYLTLAGLNARGFPTRWRYDFVQMLAWTPVNLPNYRVDYDFRRESGTSWQMKVRPDSAAKEAERLRQSLASIGGKSSPLGEEIEQRILDLESPKWVTIDGGTAELLESHYQRFVHQYRES